MSFFDYFSKSSKNYEKSIFGFIGKNMDELVSILGTSVDITTEEYKFPEIIITGDEKNGKSSLLENITKCKIFPKDRAYCTKRPIRFILKNGEKPSFTVTDKVGEPKTFGNTNDVYSHLTNIFESMGDKTLSSQEIVIECVAPGNHNFQFVDLPGIKSFPEDLSKTTKEITDRYLVLLVVEELHPLLL